ncbi:M23 family metallopeptidase [Photobacterium aquimaris]|uniref:M23 family peptidase n=1 Tax=Photobacterium aquimaris TaxID=512643 RepID=A0A2T3HYX3_9GAMM|nr:M23 family metallopeptidase [Photobacterium aquimaris]MCP4955477.1 M23 family metallopeptidase [Photobacterium aquimaris]PSU05613.1 M23 family peptidase [Photobacterium aquimaris]
MSHIEPSSSEPSLTNKSPHPLQRYYRAAMIITVCGIFSYGSYSMFHLYQNAKISQIKAQKLSAQALALSASLSEETAMNHDLNQELASKKKSLVTLNQRIDDMETVLGIEPVDETQTIAQRVDTAAINSAVRATLLQLIPNGPPTPNVQLTSGFGTRVHPITKKRKRHDGLDFAAKIGTPIYAPADAVIERARSSNYGYGNQLTLNHTMGFISTYSHMSKFKVKQGEFVKKGQLIGWTGNSGLSTGPHLHYEIRFLGKPLNPRPFVKWNIENFDELFKQEKNVQWTSLLDTINGMVAMQVQLTGDENHDIGITTVNYTKPINNQDDL